MSERSLVLLQFCLLALIYSVFLRVLRAVWVELRAEQGFAVSKVPKSVGQARDVSGGVRNREDKSRRRAERATELVVVAPPALAGRKFMLSAESTLGRAPGCSVRIDDVRVSKLHARLFLHQGVLYLEDLGSTNGTRLDGEALTGPTQIKRGARIQIAEIELILA